MYRLTCRLVTVLVAVCFTWLEATRADEIFNFVLIDVERHSETREVRVLAPFVRVKVGPTGTRVLAPFVWLETEPAANRLRAPFTWFGSRHYLYPYQEIQVSLPRPPTVSTVQIQLSPKVRVLIPQQRLAIQPKSISVRPAPARLQVPETPSKQQLGKSAAPPYTTESFVDKKSPVVTRGLSSNNVQEMPQSKQIKSPSYLIIPLSASDPVPKIRVAIQRSKGIGPQPRASHLIPPAPAAEEEPKNKAMSTNMPQQEIQQVLSSAPQIPSPSHIPREQMYKLEPMWHTEVPQYFQATAGVHVFAFIHPYTRQTVCIPVGLPEGRPQIKIKKNEVQFDYGQREVEIDFKRDGRIVVH